jgi:hypothetical protein
MVNHRYRRVPAGAIDRLFFHRWLAYRVVIMVWLGDGIS